MARQTFEYGDATLGVDTEKQEVDVDGEIVRFTPREATLFFLLVAHQGKVVTAAMILNAFYGEDTSKDPSAIKIYCYTTKKKLGPVAGLVDAVPGRGLRFGSAEKSVKPPQNSRIAWDPTHKHIISSVNLPIPGMWMTGLRKATILALLAAAAVSEEDLVAYYGDLSLEEIQEWKHLFSMGGIHALETKQAQKHRWK